MLESKIKHSWVDPRKVDEKDKDKFFYEYVLGWANANAAQELLQFISEMEQRHKALTEKKKGENINKFKIGG